MRFGRWTNNQELNGLGGYFDPGAVRPHRGLVPRSRHVPADQRRVLRLHRLRRRGHPAEPSGRSPCRASTSRGTSTARATTSLRGGYGMFYNRNMGNVEYDNSLRLAPNAYQVSVDLWAGGGYGNGTRADLRHRERGHAGQPDRQPGDQHAESRLVHVPEDAQLQRCRTRGGSRSTRSSRPPTSARAAATWSAAATAT